MDNGYYIELGCNAVVVTIETLLFLYIWRSRLFRTGYGGVSTGRLSHLVVLLMLHRSHDADSCDIGKYRSSC